jgi:hypothetical protein
MAGSPLIPAVGDVDTTFRDIGKLFFEEIKAGGFNADCLNVQLTALLANTTWIGSSPVSNSATQYRTSKAGLIVGFLRSLLDPIMESYLSISGSEHATVEAGFQDIIDYFIDNTKTIARRNPTFDLTPTVTGTGTPTTRRLTVNDAGFIIESVYGESITLKADTVQPNVELGQETFKVTTPRGFDIFSLDITGEKNSRAQASSLTSLNDDNSFIGSASMELADLATAMGGLSNMGAWTISTADLANVEIIEDGYIESVTERQIGDSRTPSATVKLAARLHANMSFYQTLPSLVLNQPCDWGFAVRADAGVTGTATLTVGNNATCTISFGSLVAATWTPIFPTLNQNLWPKNFLVDNPRITFQVTSLTGGTGYVDVDTFFMTQFTKFGGTWWHMLAGATAVEEDYKAVFADTIPADVVLQKLLFFAYGFDVQLPHSATPSIAQVT